MNRWQFLLLSLGILCRAFPGTAQTAPSKWVSYDAASKTVTFDAGGAAPVVPPGSNVVMNGDPPPIGSFRIFCDKTLHGG